MNIREMLRLKPAIGDVGIEIEVEGSRLPTQEYLKSWRCEKDGSLRGSSMEYVLRKPMYLADASMALSELDSAYEYKDTVVKDSIRAGIHVHVNVQELTFTQLFNFVVSYYILEEALVSWCGPSRVGNLFCLRSTDADVIMSYIRYALSKRDLASLHNDEIRYSSLNLKALGDYGSLEFRAMHSTRDLNRVYMWAETLVHLREASKTFHTPIEIVDYYFKDSRSACNMLLGKHAKDFLVYSINDRGGPRIANDVAHMIDWEEISYKKIGELLFPENIEFPEEPLEDF